MVFFLQINSLILKSRGTTTTNQLRTKYEVNTNLLQHDYG